MNKVRWGILGVSKFAVTKMIPGLRKCTLCEIAGIASREFTRAQDAAREFEIPHAYGSYEAMLADPAIEAVYIPLPNHMHVPWSIRAAEAGKHVLCEKPIGMNAAETLELIAARDRTGVTIGEAFMVRTHPQWTRTMDLVRAGRIGKLQAAAGTFSYVNLKSENIRNIRDYGGGALYDIGCYPIKTSRMVFGEEPRRVSATIVRDARFGGVDVLTSAILEYPSGHAIFTCSTQLAPQQGMKFYGTGGRIEIELPFNPLPDAVSRIYVDGVLEEIPPCDQYTVQGDAFSRAIREGTPPPVPLEDSLNNMRVIEAAFRAAESGRWEEPLSHATASQR
jgi:predicted dehydrogenase